MRRLLLVVLRGLGVLRLWQWRHRRAVLILTVHGVVDETAPSGTWRPLRRRVTAAWLDACLTVLKSTYTFVPLEDAVDMLAGRRPLVSYAMALTFDDGYRTQVTAVAPVLRRHGVPAMVFVSTGPVVSRTPFWFDRLDYALQHSVHGTRDEIVGGQPLTIDGTDRVRLAASYAELRLLAKAPPRDDREMNHELDRLAERLERESGRELSTVFETDPWSSLLTVDEIRRTEAPMTFGSHTVDHWRVHRLDRDAVVSQLAESKADLETWTGRPCRVFCYPDGGVSAEAADLVRACGYDAAVTADHGVNRAGADLMCLRRIDLPASGSVAELLAEVSGFKDWLLQLRDRLRPR